MCNINKKWRISVNLGQFEDETPYKQHANLNLLDCENATEKLKRELHAGV